VAKVSAVGFVFAALASLEPESTPPPLSPPPPDDEASELPQPAKTDAVRRLNTVIAVSFLRHENPYSVARLRIVAPKEGHRSIFYVDCFGRIPKRL
jgi:hypothetical protein